MKKTCFKCRKSKTLESFYAHPRMADGHLNKCITCAKKDVNQRYHSAAGRKKIAAYEKLRTKTQHRRLAALRYQAKRRRNRPGAYRAHMAVQFALRDGRLVRKPCEKCGNPKTEAHHDDYRRKLNVRWLCFKHHREVHGQQVMTL